MASPSDTPAGGFRSLTTRLIVWTLLAVGGVYLVAVTVSNTIARRMAIAAAEREAVNETEAAVSRVEDLLHSVEERTLALGEALSVLGSREPDADRLLRRFVEGNRDVYGGAIAWVPGARGERRALYYHWAAGRRERASRRPTWPPTPTATGSATGSRHRSPPDGPSGPSRTATRAGARSRWSRSPSPSAAGTARRPGS